MAQGERYFSVITKLSIILSIFITIVTALWYLAAEDKSNSLNSEDNRILWQEIDELNQRIQRVEDRQHEQSDLLLQIVAGLDSQNKATNK